MKSTADLFGDFRNAMKQGEKVEDYILKQKPKMEVNLEDAIKESVIEMSMSSARGLNDNEGGMGMGNMKEFFGNNMHDKSLSLDNNNNNEE